ncbi:MAG: DNA repair protein RecO [candidate division Zixibacteria bacterium]|nr:DNA repair protein RecO [candidate division Zixibacteria bacterium]
MALHKTEGIILSSADWSESSQTLNVFTPDCGKISLTVKGSKKINGKRGRALKFSRLEFSCYIRGEKASGYLSDVDPVEVFMFEKDGQLGRLTFASAALETLNNLLEAGEPQAVCYQITLSFLRMTDSIEKKRLPGLFAGYILRLVSLLGFRPNLVGCAGCGKDIRTVVAEDETLLLSIERGGMVCGSCRKKMPGENSLIGLKPDFHARLVRLMEASLVEASKIPISLSDLNLMVDILTTLLKFHAGTMKKLKSFDFLDKLSKAVKTYGG